VDWNGHVLDHANDICKLQIDEFDLTLFYPCQQFSCGFGCIIHISTSRSQIFLTLQILRKECKDDQHTQDPCSDQHTPHGLHLHQ
jgi:hypothetical protein